MEIEKEHYTEKLLIDSLLISKLNFINKVIISDITKETHKKVIICYYFTVLIWNKVMHVQIYTIYLHIYSRNKN